jgi:hypothetical protein
MKPRRSIGMNVFGLPVLQLGDIVEIEYKVDSVNQVSLDGARFVVYQIDYSYNTDGPTMQVYVSEVA